MILATLNSWQIALIVIASIVALVIGFILFVKYGWFRKLVYNLVVKAEVLIKESGQGQVKKAMVVDWIHEKLPNALKPFISKELISQTIDKAVEKMNKYLKEQSDK